MKRMVLAAAAAWAASAAVVLAQAPAERPFDPAGWPKQVLVIGDGGAAGFNPARKAMVRDLVDSRRLIGLSKQELTALLGPGEGAEDVLTYELGGVAIGDFNPSTLVIRLNGGEAVDSATTEELRFARPFAAEAFDAARWPKAEPVSHAPRSPGSDHWLTLVDPTRLDMAEDLARNNRLAGLDRAQVEAMLGRATVEDLGAALLLGYDLAPSLHLVVRLDGGRVSRAAVLRD